MDNKKHHLLLTTCAAVILFSIFWPPVSAFSEESGNRFSFRFENCTVTDALREISAKSGINITTKIPLKEETIKKSYVNRRLDSIITDLLKGENCAVVWNYNEGTLLSIILYTFDENNVKRSGSVASRNSRSISEINLGDLPGDMNIDDMNQIRNNYLNSRANNSRSDRSQPSSRTSAERSSTGNRTSQNSTRYGTSTTQNSDENAAPDTPGYSANMQRGVINNQNTQTDDETADEEEAEEVSNTDAPPEEPEEEKGSGLERPPMPPGL